MQPEAFTITLSDEDYAITNQDHKRLLYIERYWKGIFLIRILVDTGSSINILPLGARNWVYPERSGACREIPGFQTAFVPHRHIQENIILTQDIIHTIRRKTGPRWTGPMAIKADMEKAFE